MTNQAMPGGDEFHHSMFPMPPLGAEIVRLIFRLGCLTTDQLVVLLNAGLQRDRSKRRLNQTLRLLACPDNADRPYPDAAGFQPLVVSAKRPLPYSTANGGIGKVPRGHVHHLTSAGLGYAADDQKLYLGVARSMYSRVFQQATIDHALLRNEFFAKVVLEASGPAKAGLLTVETVCGESGVNPIRLVPKQKHKRRFLNPDGILEVFLPRDDGPDERIRVLVESDTGSQYHYWQIAAKADLYAEYLLQVGGISEGPSGLRASSNIGPAADLPKILFMSPNEKRSYCVRDALIRAAKEPERPFAQARQKFRERGFRFTDLFYVTNLQWIRDTGALGPSFGPLGRPELRGLFDEAALVPTLPNPA